MSGTAKFTTVERHLGGLMPGARGEFSAVVTPAEAAVLRGAYLTTYTGRQVTPMAPVMGMLCIEDIAHALAHECRFNGFVREFYSVAEHCVRVSWVVPPADALRGLLHDATEAYLKDIPTPLKRLPAFDAYRAAEGRLANCIALWAGLDGELETPAVKEADLRMRATEQRDLRGLDGGISYDATILPWDIGMARAKFLRRYADLVMQVFGDDTSLGYCQACNGVLRLTAAGRRPLIRGVWKHICANCEGDFSHQLVSAEAPNAWVQT